MELYIEILRVFKKKCWWLWHVKGNIVGGYVFFTVNIEEGIRCTLNLFITKSFNVRVFCSTRNLILHILPLRVFMHILINNSEKFNLRLIWVIINSPAFTWRFHNWLIPVFMTPQCFTWKMDSSLHLWFSITLLSCFY